MILSNLYVALDRVKANIERFYHRMILLADDVVTKDPPQGVMGGWASRPERSSVMPGIMPRIIIANRPS
jgi:hypothetical protein